MRTFVGPAKIFFTLGMILISSLNGPRLVAQQSEQLSTRGDQRNVALTVYNSDTGLVRETRRLRLPQGTVRLRFVDVPTGIDPTTVYVKPLDRNNPLTVLEQKYEYDLLKPEKLLDYYVGKELTIVRSMTVNNTEQLVPVRATLLANNDGEQIWRIDGEVVIRPHISEIRFPSLPDKMTSRPTLVWLLSSNRAGEHEIETSYMTSGLNWNADYILVVNETETSGDLSAWATITNKSGAEYRDAELRLIAGEIRRTTPALPKRDLYQLEAARAAAAPAPQFEERSLFEYHLYTLDRRATIANNETKQISMISGRDSKLTKEYVISGQQYYYRQQLDPGQPQKEDVQVTFSLKNSRENRLGIPLPAGVVRVYKTDAIAGQQFVGEDRIEHTPLDETVRIRVGNAFDIIAERKQTAYTRIARNVFEYEYEIVIRNRKKEDVTIVVNEPVGSDWEMVNSTFPWEKATAVALRFRVPVAREAEAKLVYRIRVKY